MSIILPVFPDWMKTLYFNYAYFDNTKTFSSPGNTEEVAGENWVNAEVENTTYTTYNKRHRPTMQLMLKKALQNKTTEESTTSRVAYSATMILTPWAWDEDQSVKENRLGMLRTGGFAFADYMVAELKLDFNTVEEERTAFDGVTKVKITSFALTNTEEGYFLYDDKGKKTKEVKVKRTGQASMDIDRLIAFIKPVCVYGTALDDDGNYIANPNLRNFPKQVKSWNFAGIIDRLDVTELSEDRYTQLSSDMHSIFTARASPNDSSQLKSTVSDYQRVLAQIPRQQRVQALDTSQWCEVSLEDSPLAAAARYHKIIFNNAYANLSNQDDISIQQIIGAVDTDFTHAWLKNNVGNFNDIRALQSTMLNYIQMLAAFTTRKLGIRYQYLEYVGQVIYYFENMRGLTTNSNYGVHSVYPWFNQIQSTYVDFLPEVFEIFRIELSANDTAQFLLDRYKSNIEIYNRWMSGSTAVAGLACAQLGDDTARFFTQTLQNIQVFKERFWWAAIDRALNEAYMSDTAFTGSVRVNDAAVTLKPGDSLKLDFMDTNAIMLKVIGVEVTVSPDDIEYSAQVKKQWG